MKGDFPYLEDWECNISGVLIVAGQLEGGNQLHKVDSGGHTDRLVGPVSLMHLEGSHSHGKI